MSIEGLDLPTILRNSASETPGDIEGELREARVFPVNLSKESKELEEKFNKKCIGIMKEEFPDVPVFIDKNNTEYFLVWVENNNGGADCIILHERGFYHMSNVKYAGYLDKDKVIETITSLKPKDVDISITGKDFMKDDVLRNFHDEEATRCQLTEMVMTRGEDYSLVARALVEEERRKRKKMASTPGSHTKLSETLT